MLAKRTYPVGGGSGSHARTNDLNQVGEEKINHSCFVDEIRERYVW